MTVWKLPTKIRIIIVHTTTKTKRDLRLLCLFHRYCVSLFLALVSLEKGLFGCNTIEHKKQHVKEHVDFHLSSVLVGHSTETYVRVKACVAPSPTLITAALCATAQKKLGFIVCVKTATKTFLLKAIWQTLMPSKGLYAGLSTMIAGAMLIAYVWADCVRRYFIASAGNLTQGDPTIRVR